MNEAKRRVLAARAMNDVAAAQIAGVVALADSHGVFQALRQTACTAAEIAARCRLLPAEAEYLLVALASSSYVDFDLATKRYSLSDEQASLFADEGSAMFLIGAFDLAAALAAGDLDRAEMAIARSSRAKFPSLVERRWGSVLEAAGRLAELGCGRGSTLVEIVRRHPALRATGVDTNRTAIQAASAQPGITWVAGTADSLEAAAFDVVLTLEGLHEFADAAFASSGVFNALRDDGAWLLVEPVAPIADDVGRRFLASLGALYCIPAAGAGAEIMGPLVSRQRYYDVLSAAGFRNISIDDEGPWHVAIEARK